MKIMTTLAVALVFTLSACGGGPSTEDLADSLTKDQGLSAEQSKCAAEVLKDSDMSDERLEKMVDGTDVDFDLTSDENEILEKIGPELEKCSSQ